MALLSRQRPLSNTTTPSPESRSGLLTWQSRGGPHTTRTPPAHAPTARASHCAFVSRPDLGYTDPLFIGGFSMHVRELRADEFLRRVRQRPVVRVRSVGSLDNFCDHMNWIGCSLREDGKPERYYWHEAEPRTPWGDASAR